MVNRDEDAEPLDYPEPLPRPGTAPRSPDADPRDSALAMPSAQEIARFFA